MDKKVKREEIIDILGFSSEVLYPGVVCRAAWITSDEDDWVLVFGEEQYFFCMDDLVNARTPKKAINKLLNRWEDFLASKSVNKKRKEENHRSNLNQIAQLLADCVHILCPDIECHLKMPEGIFVAQKGSKKVSIELVDIWRFYDQKREINDFLDRVEAKFMKGARRS